MLLVPSLACLPVSWLIQQQRSFLQMNGYQVLDENLVAVEYRFRGQIRSFCQRYNPFDVNPLTLLRFSIVIPKTALFISLKKSFPKLFFAVFLFSVLKSI